jgi:hypothetical protein
MYWWNVSKLAEDLREGRVQNKECWKYLLANLVLWCLIVLLIIYSGGPFWIKPPLSWLAYLVMASFGTMFCYKANKKGDNADFFLRMNCLGLPAGIQWASFCAAAVLWDTVLTKTLPAAAHGPSTFVHKVWEVWTDADDAYGSNWGTLFFLFYYWTIYGAIAFVAKVKGAEKSRLILMPASDWDWRAATIVLGMLSGLGLIVITVMAGVWVPSSNERDFVWRRVAFLVVALWTGLFVFISSRLRQALKKHA